jgi:hypothetical protein
MTDVFLETTESADARFMVGTLAARPTPELYGPGSYLAKDEDGGTLYVSDGDEWSQAATSVNQGGAATVLAYAEADFAGSSSQFVTGSLAAGAAQDVTGLTIAFTVPSDASYVLLEAGAYTWQAGTIGVRSELQITTAADAVRARTRTEFEAANKIKQGPYARRLLVAVPLAAASYKVRIGNGAGGVTGTTTLFAVGGESPAWIAATALSS